MLTNTDRDWCRWGEIEPYFGVLADPVFRRSALAAHKEAFFEIGRRGLEERVAAAERYFGPLKRQSALDFGCGVGRLSLPLARLFDDVVALDISPAMLAEATDNANAQQIENCRFALSDDALAEAPGPFDFVISSLVLQHLPVRRGMRITRLLLDRVAPGGVIALQFCIARNDSPASRWRYWAQRHVPFAHPLFNIASGRPWREPLMQMNAYRLQQMLDLVETAAFDVAPVETMMHGRFTTAQLIARRR